MKACIYQKQEPVDIPQVETGMLTDVLNLPCGVEIYGLLTRWNPLNVAPAVRAARTTAGTCSWSASARPATRCRTICSTRASAWWRSTGSKIEPLPDDIVGAPSAIRRGRSRAWSEIYQPLDERVLEGFGGVSEYGITVRWDKNFLSLIHLTLARRDEAQDLRRRPLRRRAADRRGVGARHRSRGDRRRCRPADDHRHQEQPDPRHPQGQRLPDGAAAHRRVQGRRAVEPAGAAAGGGDRRRAHRHRHGHRAARLLPAAGREDSSTGTRRWSPRSARRACASTLDAEERGILDEFLVHGRAVRAERARARRRGEAARLRRRWFARWGGVTLAYRKRLQDSPGLPPESRGSGEGARGGHRLRRGHVRRTRPFPTTTATSTAMAFTQPRRRRRPASSCRRAPCSWPPARRPTSPTRRSIRAASRSTARQRFFQGYRAVKRPDGTFTLEPDAERLLHLVRHAAAGSSPTTATTIRATTATSSRRWRRPSTDTITSSRCSPTRSRSLDPAGQPEREGAWRRLVARLDDELLARVERVVRLTPTIIEVVVRAPAAARHFHPGQFYRLQNFERRSPHVHIDDHVAPMLMEGIALTGAWVDREKGLLSLITLEMGVSSRLCAYLQPGEPVVVMGPTGHSYRDPRALRGACWPAAASATPCCSRSRRR